MRWRSVTSPTAYGAARPSRSPGRGRSANYRAPSGWNCSSFWRSEDSIAAPPMTSLAARPGRRCAASRPRSGRPRMDLPLPRCWNGSADGDSGRFLPLNTGTVFTLKARPGGKTGSLCNRIMLYDVSRHSAWARKLPACGLIQLLWLLFERSIATEPHAQDHAQDHARDKILFAGVHRNRPPDRDGGGGGAIGWCRSAGVGAIFQFRRTAAVAAIAAIRTAWPRLVRRRPVRAIPAARAQANRELLQGAAAGKTRNHPRAQRAGAWRRDGGLARLWSGGRLCRAAGHGRDPQTQDRLRADQISAQGRSGGLARGRQDDPCNGKDRKSTR